MGDALNRPEENGAPSAWSDWPIDREIVIVRVIDAPRRRVFAAWSDPDQIQRWFGPDGFAVETREISVAPGGVWRFDMVAPDGARYGNRMTFLRIEPPTLLEVLHGPDRDDAEGAFRMLATFDEQNDGKTVLTLRQLHPSKAQRDATIGFGAVELGGQTLAKLARHLSSAPENGAPI